MKTITIPRTMTTMFAALLFCCISWSSPCLAQESNSSKYTYKLVLRELTKGINYSAKSPDKINTSWQLIRVNRNQPSKSDKQKFKKQLDPLNGIINAFQSGSIPNTITYQQRTYILAFKETDFQKRPSKLVYKTEAANSQAHKISVKVTYSYFNTMLLESIEKRKINIRNGGEETEFILSFFNYSR